VDTADAARPGELELLSFRAGRIAAIDAFLDPAVHRRFALPDELPALGDQLGAVR
jgi:hypothetical protein